MTFRKRFLQLLLLLLMMMTDDYAGGADTASCIPRS